MSAPVNWFGHEVSITYTKNKDTITYSCGMWQAVKALETLYAVATDSDCQLISISCPQELIDQANAGEPEVASLVNSLLSGVAA